MLPLLFQRANRRSRVSIAHTSAALAAVAAVAALGATALALAPAQAASAAPVDAVTAVTIQAPDPAHPDTPLTVGQRFRVDAQWALPSGAQPGDTFTLSFPSPVRGYSSQFELRDSTGADVGSCVVVSTSVTCTVGAYAATHSGIAGSLYFYATAASAATGDVLFSAGSTATITVPLPGGGIQPGTGGGGWPAPTTLTKGGWQNTDGTLGWNVNVPGALLTNGGSEVELTDTYDGRLTLHPGSLEVYRVPIAGWNNGDWGASATRLTEGTGAGTFSFTPAAASFALTVHQPDPASVYTIYYRLDVPAGIPDGTVFANTASGRSLGDAQASVDYVTAGGAASGITLRSIAVTKQVTGDGVAPSGTFPVTVTCTSGGSPVSGYPATAAIAAGQTKTFPGIPVGAQCTVTETDSRGATSVAYAPTGDIAVTQDSPTTIPVTITNDYAAAPPTSTPTPTPTPTAVVPPTTPASPASGAAPVAGSPSSPSGTLAHTGSDTTGAGMLGITAAMAVAAGLGMLVLRRVRRSATRR